MQQIAIDPYTTRPWNLDGWELASSNHLRIVPCGRPVSAAASRTEMRRASVFELRVAFIDFLRGRDVGCLLASVVLRGMACLREALRL